MRFLFPLTTMMLMQAAQGEGGGGGGAPAGDGAPGGGDAPKYVTEAQLNELMNKALGARDKRFEAKVGEMFGGFTKSLDERLASLAPKPADDPGSDTPKRKDPEQVKRDREFEELKKSFEAEKQARVAAETKSRNQRADNELQAALGRVGVRPEAMSRLLKSFKAEVSYDDDGNPMLPVEDGATSIDAAIASWAKSDEAKAFMPAPNAGGAGTQRAASAGAGNQSWRTKPREQWTDADRDAYAAHRAGENGKLLG